MNSSMKYFEVKPQLILSGIIKCFWYLEKDYRITPNDREIVLPDACIDFVFHAGGEKIFTEKEGKLIRQPSAFAIGQQNQAVVFTSKGKTSLIGVRFYAYGAYPILQVPIHELTDQIIELGGLFTPLPQLGDFHSPLEIIRNLEQVLTHLFLKNNVDFARIQAATNLLFLRNGLMDIAELARYTNLSIRSLERGFKITTGHSPKTLARVIRFNRIKDNLILDPGLNLTDLAHRYGFFDQAHFIHDFKKFTDKTPSSFSESVVNREIYFYK